MRAMLANAVGFVWRGSERCGRRVRSHPTSGSFPWGASTALNLLVEPRGVEPLTS